MRYVIRADASGAIGSGHVMRSSAIAEELIARGEEVIFVGGYCEVPWLAVRIKGLGFSQTFSEVAGFNSDANTDILILDSYFVPIDDEFIQRRKWKAIVVIMDELTPSYVADLFVHPGLSVKSKTISTAKILAGPRYVPFRKSIKKNEKLEVRKKALEIIVVGGGVDSYNFAAAICGALKKNQSDFHAVIFTTRSELAQLDSRFTAVPIGSELDKYAANADLVFATASTTSLEFIAREVAIGIGCAVNNQEEYYMVLSSLGVASPIGRFVEDCWEIDQHEIDKLVNSNQFRENLREKCANLIDLNGARRIVDEILRL